MHYSDKAVVRRMFCLFTVTTCFLLLGSLTISLHGQCTNPSIALPDVSIPVDGNVQNAYCVTLTFDPQETGLPSGVSMDIHHTWQGDLGIWIVANGNYLNIVQRPGLAEGCAGDCPCGDSGDLGFPPNPSTYVFSDGGGPDPEGGMAPDGGNYSITADDDCGLGSPGINSFADLWATYEPGEEITAILCISDHADNDSGEASNISFLFPNPVICGCTDPEGDNYNPDANVDDGTCEYSCPDFGTMVSPIELEFCGAEEHLFTLTAIAPNVDNPTFSWTGTNNGTSFLANPSSSSTQVTLPVSFTGNVQFTVLVTDEDDCTETAMVEVVVFPLPVVNIIGSENLCVGDSLTLQASEIGSEYLWSTGSTDATIIIKTGGDYSLTLTDENGCINADGLSVQQYALPVPNIQGPTSIYLGEEVDLRVTDLFAEYFWSTGATTQLITVDSPTVYRVTITDENGCPGTAELTIAEDLGYNLYTPNAFSPNLDGVNDYFHFFSDHRSVERIVSLQVFDRWGSLVFSNADFLPDLPEEGWDGTRNNKTAPNGIYVWTALVELASGELVQLQGDVLLLGKD